MDDDLQSIIKAEYEAGAGPKALAEKHGISVDTIKSWIKRKKWKRGAAPSDDEGAPSKVERVHPEERSGSPPEGKSKRTRHVKQTRRGAPDGNDNAKGNSGGGAPDGNDNAVTHGFYRTLLPARLQRIAEQMEGRDVLEMLREQITVISSIIFDSLQQLYVDDMNDHRQFITKEKAPSGAFLGAETEDGDVVLGEIEREWHTAWDRQAKALQGYERAVGRFQSLVQTYMKLSGEGDLFRLQIEKMEQGIKLDRERFEHQKAMDEARLDLATYKALPPSDDDEPTESDGYDEAMSGMTAAEVWDDDTPSES